MPTSRTLKSMMFTVVQNQEVNCPFTPYERKKTDQMVKVFIYIKPCWASGLESAQLLPFVIELSGIHSGYEDIKTDEYLLNHQRHMYIFPHFPLSFEILNAEDIGWRSQEWAQIKQNTQNSSWLLIISQSSWIKKSPLWKAFWVN